MTGMATVTHGIAGLHISAVRPIARIKMDQLRALLARLALAAAVVVALASATLAQTYPSRLITLVVPFAAGGPADYLARILGQRMSEDLGQQIMVSNRPGANTIVGAQAVARANPDGYTLLLAIDGTLVMNPFLYNSLAYDPFKDFEPISLVARVPSALVGLEKAKPGSFMIGSSTPTSQVAIELLNMMAGTKMTTVPYKGGSTQITGTLAGDIPLGMESINVALPLFRANKIKILGLTSDRRLSFAPEIPTIAETFPGYDLGIWQSMVAPAGTPKEIVRRLHAAIKKVLAMPEVQNKLLVEGIEAAGSETPEAFAAFIRAQAETRGKVIQAVGIKLD
jgi:tripartite-type tricarboxylate transporter receptor subunit TctC